MKKPYLFSALEATIGTLAADMFEGHVGDIAEEKLREVEERRTFPASFMRANANFSTVREALLGAVTNGFDWASYVGGPDLRTFVYDPREVYGSIRRRFTLAAIASWMTSSRRVFSVTPELQALLALTSLKKTDWTMMEWPFDSFILNLAYPMEYGEGKWKTHCDAILIGRESKTPDATIVYADDHEKAAAESAEHPFSIYLLRKNLQGLNQCYPIQEQQRLLRLARNNPDKANETIGRNKTRKWNEARGWFSYYVPADIFSSNGIPNLVYETGFDTNEATVGVTKIMEVLFGTMFYMASLQQSKRANVENRGEWIKPEQSASTTLGRAITDASLVALIGSEIKMAPEELARFREFATRTSNGVDSVSAHFRIGFWHRARGSGQDPDAPKSEWTRPTIVRRDKLPDGSLPTGAETKVS